MATPSNVRWIGVGAAIVSASAAAGAVGLMTGELSITDRLNERLPFDSPVVGGIALAVLVSVPFFVLAVLAVRGDRSTPVISMLVGTSLCAWIVVQLAFLREVSFFHPLFFAVGVGFIVAGRSASKGASTDRPPPARSSANASVSGRPTGTSA